MQRQPLNTVVHFSDAGAWRPPPPTFYSFFRSVSKRPPVERVHFTTFPDSTFASLYLLRISSLACSQEETTHLPNLPHQGLVHTLPHIPNRRCPCQASCPPGSRSSVQRRQHSPLARKHKRCQGCWLSGNAPQFVSGVLSRTGYSVQTALWWVTGQSASLSRSRPCHRMVNYCAVPILSNPRTKPESGTVTQGSEDLGRRGGAGEATREVPVR